MHPELFLELGVIDDLEKRVKAGEIVNAKMYHYTRSKITHWLEKSLIDIHVSGFNPYSRFFKCDGVDVTVSTMRTRA